MKNPFALFGHQWIAKTATLVVVVAGTAAVVVSNVPQPVDRTLSHLPAEDVASWAMPLDRYLLVDTHKSDYANDLLVGKCLAARGIDWDVPWQGPLAFPADGDFSVSRPLASHAAAERGYHGAAEDGLSTYLWHRFSTQPPLTGHRGAAVDSCIRSVRRTDLPITAVDGRAQEAGVRAVQLANRAYDAAGRESAVIAAARRWRSCLAPAYDTALAPAQSQSPSSTVPSSPAEMPSTAIRQTFSTEVSSSPVTSAETTLAVKDAACQTSSGYRAALYDAEYRLQSKVTADDAAVFAAATVDQRAYDRRLDRIIAGNLPAKPRT
ncbi:hypothetical protein GCM10025867_42150 [Frondihabitans sucicola]|uniref:Uncharacterized protein n=1 Tax=Frondihabitans sucicola TaxID=1268041 RepID=A0ABM8GUH6_9MICO|nr:hypothetical protein [Frondihabitans sucicola]BDZ51974.1 hypothetical protein GCM10025867_42150 [Frondihabitans sucicola]